MVVEKWYRIHIYSVKFSMASMTFRSQESLVSDLNPLTMWKLGYAVV
jgi:hypothetical protein